VEDNLLRKVIASFKKKYPKIKVNYTALGGDYDATMIAKFAARKPPDVFYVNGHVFPVWVSQGVLQPLTPYIKKTHYNTKPFYPRLLSGFKYKGQTYGFPKDWGPLAMFVNTDMLQKAGAKIPTSWATLLSTAQKLKSSNAVPGGAPVCFSDDWARLMAFVYQNGYKGGILRSNSILSPKVRGRRQLLRGVLEAGLAKRPQDLGRAGTATRS
jgi:multiple sugar transport system substrate-binding protein